MQRSNDNARVKKAKLDEPLLLPPNVQVKQEAHEPRPSGGGDAVVAEEGDTRKKIHIINFDATLLHCPVCSDRLRPPVFQCAACLHIACSGCQGRLPGKRCHSCADAGSAYACSPWMDKVICAAKVRCAHHQHGCTSDVAYYEAADHESACPRAPCSCTVPGCRFVASPPNLLGHLASAHAWPVHNIRYGTQLELCVPASGEPRVLLVAAEEDGAVFLLSAGAFGTGMAVSLVCVRANGVAGEQYGLNLWVHGSGDRTAVVLTCSEVTSSAAPGEVDVDAGQYLVVPPTMMAGPQAGREMVLTVRIDEAS